MCSGLPAPFTIEPCDGPVLPHCRWHTWQLEDEGPHIWIDVSVGGRDVDDIQVWLLTDLRLLWQQLRGVVVDVDQVDLQGAGAAGRGNSCTGTGICHHHLGSSGTGNTTEQPLSAFSSSNKPGFLTFPPWTLVGTYCTFMVPGFKQYKTSPSLLTLLFSTPAEQEVEFCRSAACSNAPSQTKTTSS